MSPEPSPDRSEGRRADPTIDEFLAREERPLSAWRWLWQGDHRLPLPRHPGWLGGLKFRLKRLLGRVTTGSQLDLWDRQRLYNLAVQERLAAAEELEGRAAATAAKVEHLEGELRRLGEDLQRVQTEVLGDLRQTRDDLQGSFSKEMRRLYEQLITDLGKLHDHHQEYLESHDDRLGVLEGLQNEGFDELRRHLDSLYSRVDLKLDDYRRRSRHLWSRLQALLSAVEEGGVERLERTAREQDYLELEGLFRGEEAEIERRIEPYLEVLEGRGEILDLGCGRGEALELLARRGIPCRGVDSNAEMVARCREKGLEVVEGELFDTLTRLEPGSLGGIVSFHVIEHLPPESLDRLVRLAWRGLAEEGVLILETPNPLSLVVAARNFWLDPTHRRPVHPDALELSYRLAGFDPVERLDLQPFAEEARLPAISAHDLPQELQTLVRRVNRLRDALDALIFGYQDFGMVGIKPRSRAMTGASETPAS